MSAGRGKSLEHKCAGVYRVISAGSGWEPTECIPSLWLRKPLLRKLQSSWHWGYLWKELVHTLIQPWHPRHRGQGSSNREVPTVQLWDEQTCLGEKQKVRDLPRTLGQGWGPYPRTQPVQRSPAWHSSIGVSGSHQGSPIPPGKSTQPRPQKSQGPVMMGTECA